MKTQHIPKNIIVIALIALASGFGQDLITPALPGFLLSLGIGTAGIGLIDGLLSGTTSIGRLLGGLLSDKMKNRKQYVFAGYALSSVARPLLSIVGSIFGVGILRGIDGLGKGIKDAPRDALIADSAPISVRGRSFGFHRLVDTAGSVLGPILAGSLLLWLGTGNSTYRLIFLLSAIPGAIALILIIFGIKEPRQAKISSEKITAKLPMVFWMFILASCLVSATRINDSLILLRAENAGVSLALLPFLFGGFTLIYAILSYYIGIISDRFGRPVMLAIGWIILGIVHSILALNSGITNVLVSMGFYGLFYAFAEGSSRAIIADIIPTAKRGTAYALFHFFNGASLIGGGYLVGSLLQYWPAQYALSISVVGSFAGCAVFSIAFQKLFIKNTNMLKLSK